MRIPALIVLMVIATMLALAGAALAQMRYPGECCGEYDCFNEPVAADLVQRTPDGWLLKKEQRVIPFAMARRSPDDRFHICRNEMGKGQIIIPHGRPACLWAPEAGG